MQSFRLAVLAVSAWIASVAALTITQPSQDTVFNPQQAFTIRWTSTPSDPQTLTFTITGAGDFSIQQYQEIAANIPTSAGEVVIPANTLAYNGQYKIEARDASTSTVITTSSGFYLAQGNGETMSISQNPDVSNTGSTSAATSSAGSQISVVTGEDGTSIILSGTRTTTTTGTNANASSSPTSRGGASSTTTGGSLTTTTSPTQTPNAQIRVGGDGNSMVLSVAGLLAGLVALVA